MWSHSVSMTEMHKGITPASSLQAMLKWAMYCGGYLPSHLHPQRPCVGTFLGLKVQQFVPLVHNVAVTCLLAYESIGFTIPLIASETRNLATWTLCSLGWAWASPTLAWLHCICVCVSMHVKGQWMATIRVQYRRHGAKTTEVEAGSGPCINSPRHELSSWFL